MLHSSYGGYNIFNEQYSALNIQVGKTEVYKLGIAKILFYPSVTRGSET